KRCKPQLQLADLILEFETPLTLSAIVSHADPNAWPSSFDSLHEVRAACARRPPPRRTPADQRPRAPRAAEHGSRARARSRGHAWRPRRAWRPCAVRIAGSTNSHHRSRAVCASAPDPVATLVLGR